MTIHNSGKSRPGKDEFLTSSTLINEVKIGSPDAWEKFVENYRPWITRNCKRSGLSTHDAENISQEVFIDLFKRIQSFEHGRQGGFRRWLHLIVRSRIVDFIRLFSRNQEHVVDPGILASSPREESNENQELSEPIKKRYEQVCDHLNSQFSDRDFQILILYLAEELSPKEIASQLHISTNTVYLVKSRMIRQLKKALRGLTG